PPLNSKGEGLIWIDPTISHIRALRGSAAARDIVLEELKDLRLSEYVFIELEFRSNDEKIPLQNYVLKKVAAAELENHFLAALSKPTALSQPLDAQQLIQTLEKEFKRNVGETRLTLVTDAQAETIQPLALLGTSFLSVNVIRTPTGETERKQSMIRTSLIPEELALMWRAGDTSAGSDVMPGTPQLLKIDPALASSIPRQARPTLFLEESDAAERDNTKVAKLSLITSVETSGDEAVAGSTGNSPLMTTCTLSVAGPSELDGLSDLRAYAQFFHVPMRPLSCRSTESASSSNGQDISDPWKYRRASVWIVPVNETVAGELFQQGMYWTPEGFSPETDALVYIADTRLADLTLTQAVSMALEKKSDRATRRQPTHRSSAAFASAAAPTGLPMATQIQR
ncbi:hypothetical protein EBR21_13640, partial [bacterium]|nr:hypothetical protein [bacterium]